MAFQNQGNEFSLYSKTVEPSSADIAARRFVGWDDELLTDPAKAAQGVSETAIKTGKVGAITAIGSPLVETGGAFAKGDPITSDSQGRAIKGTEQDMKGRADGTSTGAGQFVPVQLQMAAEGIQVFKVALAAVAGAGGVLAFQNPLGAPALVERLILDITTVATAAATVNAGTGATAATASDNLIDGLDVNAAAGVFDNLGDPGTNGKSRQRFGATDYVTISQATGDVAGLIGTAYVHLIRI